MTQLDNNTRFRKAVLRMKADDTYARPITPQDIQMVWPFLCESGDDPYHLAQEGNRTDMTDERRKYLMKLLNSYL